MTFVALAGGVVAGLAPCRPTGLVAVDVVLLSAFGAIVTLAASRSSRWTWLCFAGAAAALAGPVEWLMLGLGALALAFYSITDPKYPRIVGALVGAMAAQGVLRTHEVGMAGITTGLAVLASLPVLISGYRGSRPRTQSIVKRAALGTAAFVALAVGGIAIAGLSGRASVDRAIDASRDGIDAARAGDQDEAAAAFDQANAAYDEAHSTFTRPWAVPALLVPILSQHTQTVVTVTASGTDISRTAAAAARTAPYRELRSTDGRINLALVRSMQQPVADATGALRRARSDIEEIDTEWLAPPLADPLREYKTELDRALPEAELASDALERAPGLLGGSGTRHYFVAFGTPSESRFLGGFIGSYGELTAEDGKLTLTRSGPINELNNATKYTDRVLPGPKNFLDRYGRFFPSRFMQNASASPDFPTVANVIGQLYPQMGGRSIDGAIYIDPYALAAFLQLTGPITVDGLATPLTATNAADFLLRDQYLQFPDTDERSDHLAEASRATFEALTTGELPAFDEIIDTLSPMVEQGRLLFSVHDTGEQQLLERTGLTGSFPRHGDDDFVSLRTSNANPNKIDPFLTRSVTYDVAYDPSTGHVASTATIRLTNSAPATGLPEYVIGNRDTINNVEGRPRGSNTMYLSFYTPLEVRDATLDGTPLQLEAQPEFGFTAYSAYVTVDADATAELRLRLDGSIRPGTTYRLDMATQATVNPDHVMVRVQPANADWTIAGTGPTPATPPVAEQTFDDSVAHRTTVSMQQVT